ncbi:MAG: hypothetical protein LBT05_12960 [Planctomycetaceae bacterium]|nr:hypothetical protein [Planctomycetaceae bacterium]
MNNSHVAKHFETTIANGQFSFQRNIKSIQDGPAMDGFYVIRTFIFLAMKILMKQEQIAIR